MTTQLIIVSHALTQWNIEGKIQGHTDVPLNHLGFIMAQCLAEALKKETLHAIYSSDLKRAYQTAWPTAEQKGLRIITDNRLREGRSILQERSVCHPTLPYQKEIETRTDLSCRMTDVLTQIAQRHNEQTVLVMSHGGSIDFFTSQLLETSADNVLKYTGRRMALNRFRYDQGHWTCVSLNEDIFLKNG